MLGNIFRVLISVRAKLFFGFLTMTLIICLLGGYAYVALGTASKTVESTFDRPLMAVNFSRSASQVFSDLEIERLRQSQDGRVDPKSMTALVTTFKADLDVAKSRSIAPRAKRFFTQIETDLATWERLSLLTRSANTDAEMRRIAGDIANNLDIIVELQTNQTYRAREASLAQMAKVNTYSLWAAAAAILLTLILSAWIAITIINPLKAAAIAARKISAGNFNAKIPKGGEDETGALLKTMAVMQANIAQQMGQEQNLRTLAQDRLTDSLANSRDAILLANKDGEIIVANPQVGVMFPAFKNVNLVGQPYAQYFHPSGQPRAMDCRFLEDAREIAFSDGRWTRVNSSETQEGGNLYIWTDITQDKARSRSLLEAKEQAEAADKAKSLFLAAMSHELRTPLNAVIGFSDILQKYNEGEDGNAEHAELAEIISKSGAHLLNIVKDVLTIADGGHQDDLVSKFAPVNVADVIDFCVSTISVEAESKDVSVIWQRPEQELYVSGDALRLQQLVLNLLSNAVKFNGEGGTVKIQARLHGGQHVRIDVIDNGIGIENTHLSKIVEPFAQVDNGFTRKYEGAGLGLSIVKKVLDTHRGTMVIRSKPGKGTAVSISLPVLTEMQSGGVKLAS